jgi:hypothetical protein
MAKWIRETYTVTERNFNYDLKEFVVTANDGGIIATITPDSLESAASIRKDLDAGECVDGWEDGMGNTIRI